MNLPTRIVTRTSAAVAAGLVAIATCGSRSHAQTLLSGPSWSASLPSTSFGASIDAAGDVDADGFEDVIIGAPSHFDGAHVVGRAYVFRGIAGGTATQPAWTLENPTGHFSSLFGGPVVGLGDVNGDGAADVAVGAPLAQWSGAVFVYHGAPGGLSTTPDWHKRGPGEDSNFGGVSRAVGDVDGDGFADMLVNASKYTLEVPVHVQSVGYACVYAGSANGLVSQPIWVVHGTHAFESLGAGPAGDVNGDGFPDLLVGSAGSSSTQAATRVDLYAGGPNGVTSTPVWSEIVPFAASGASLGLSASAAGDVDADGFDDLLIAAPQYESGEQHGRVELHRGAAGWPSGTPAWVAYGDASEPHFGRSLARLSDVDGDGYADWAVANPEPPGVVRVYSGGTLPLAQQPIWTKHGGAPLTSFADSLVGGRDFDGDGDPDLLLNVGGSLASPIVQRFDGGTSCGAPLAAQETVRVGDPPNPSVLLPGAHDGPVIGRVWSPRVDHASFAPTAVLDLLAIGVASANAPGALGTVLVDPHAPFVLSSAAAGGTFAVWLPDDCALVGTTWHAQAGALGVFGAPQLTNALDLVVGTH
ncbi:MAG: hypothetical protein EPO68_01510 [Planctomycetota bacterium]|nr:MAG: hypothetical protein EPO68_01510 [Planctomycetota bacterium]